MEICLSKLDRNGYAKSILQDDMTRCYLCYRTDRKLDRHEVFGASNRSKSKALGLWVLLCHEDCHQGRLGVHNNAELALSLRQQAEREALEWYGWTIDDFRREFGKNYLDLRESIFLRRPWRR